MLGKLQDRRAALKEMAGAGAALFSLAKLDLGLVQAQDVGVLGCRLTGDPCAGNSQCCSNMCSNTTKRNCKKKKGKKKKCRNENVDGVCKCQDQGKSCDRDAACCKGLCSTSNVCRCAENSEICNKDDDCCGGRTCKTDSGGNKFCKD